MYPSTNFDHCSYCHGQNHFVSHSGICTDCMPRNSNILHPHELPLIKIGDLKNYFSNFNLPEYVDKIKITPFAYTSFSRQGLFYGVELGYNYSFIPDAYFVLSSGMKHDELGKIWSRREEYARSMKLEEMFTDVVLSKAWAKAYYVQGLIKEALILNYNRENHIDTLKRVNKLSSLAFQELYKLSISTSSTSKIHCNLIKEECRVFGAERVGNDYLFPFSILRELVSYGFLKDFEFTYSGDKGRSIKPNNFYEFRSFIEQKFNDK